MNPTRTSTWDDAAFREKASTWGDFYDVARRLAEHDAFVLVTPMPGYLRVARRWVQALLEAYAGDDVAGALEAAAADIDGLVHA